MTEVYTLTLRSRRQTKPIDNLMRGAARIAEGLSLIEEAWAEAGGNLGNIHLRKYAETLRHFVQEIRALGDQREGAVVLQFPGPDPF